MKKQEFQDTFKMLVDGLVDELPMPLRFRKFAERFKAAPETVQKWYNGVSAPANVVRETIIKQLYADQKKRDLADIVKEVIRKDLTITVQEDSGGYDSSSNSYTIYLNIDKDIISTVYFDVPKCDCDGGHSF